MVLIDRKRFLLDLTLVIHNFIIFYDATRYGKAVNRYCIIFLSRLLALFNLFWI